MNVREFPDCNITYVHDDSAHDSLLQSHSIAPYVISLFILYRLHIRLRNSCCLCQYMSTESSSSLSVVECQAFFQSTVDALRSGQLELPVELAPGQVTATCKLPEYGLAPMPGTPAMPCGAKLVATKDTFLLMAHIEAIHESIKLGSVSPWSTNEHFNQIATNAAKDAIMLDECGFCAHSLVTANVGHLIYPGAIVTTSSKSRGKSAAISFAILRLIAKDTPVVIHFAGDRTST